MAINGRSLNQVKLDVTDPSTSELRFRDGVDDVLEQVDRSPTSVSLSGVITGVPAALDVNNELAITTLFDTDNGETDAMGDTIPAEESGNVLSIQGVGGDVTYRWIEGGGGGAEVREFRSIALRNAATTADTLWEIGDIASIREEEITTARTIPAPISSVAYDAMAGTASFNLDNAAAVTAFRTQLMTLGFAATATAVVTSAEMDINLNDIVGGTAFRVTIPAGATITSGDGFTGNIVFTATGITAGTLIAGSGFPALADEVTNYIYNAINQETPAATTNDDWVEIAEPATGGGGGGITLFETGAVTDSYIGGSAAWDVNIVDATTFRLTGGGSSGTNLSPGGSMPNSFLNAITGNTGTDVTAFDPGTGMTSTGFTTTNPWQVRANAGASGAAITLTVPAGTNFSVTRDASDVPSIDFQVDLTSAPGVGTTGANVDIVPFFVDGSRGIVVRSPDVNQSFAQITAGNGIDLTYASATNRLTVSTDINIPDIVTATSLGHEALTNSDLHTAGFEYTPGDIIFVTSLGYVDTPTANRPISATHTGDTGTLTLTFNNDAERDAYFAYLNSPDNDPSSVTAGALEETVVIDIGAGPQAQTAFGISLPGNSVFDPGLSSRVYNIASGTIIDTSTSGEASVQYVSAGGGEGFAFALPYTRRDYFFIGDRETEVGNADITTDFLPIADPLVIDYGDQTDTAATQIEARNRDGRYPWQAGDLARIATGGLTETDNLMPVTPTAVATTGTNNVTLTFASGDDQTIARGYLSAIHSGGQTETTATGVAATRISFFNGTDVYAVSVPANQDLSLTTPTTTTILISGNQARNDSTVTTAVPLNTVRITEPSRDVYQYIGRNNRLDNGGGIVSVTGSNEWIRIGSNHSRNDPVWVERPASSTSAGEPGQVAYGQEGTDWHLYICVDHDTWIRSPVYTATF